MLITVSCYCRVSNELGAGNARTAQHTTSVGLVLTFIVTTCLSVPMLIFRSVVPMMPYFLKSIHG